MASKSAGGVRNSPVAVAVALAVVGVGLAGCTGSAVDSALAEAESALEHGEYAKAASSAERGLKAGPKEPTVRWRLELLRLEGQARGGDVQGATATLERLVSAPSSVIQPSHYLSSADQLRAAGKGKGSIGLLHAGLLRFPTDGDLKKAIDRAKSAGGDDELQALRSLGYLD